METTPAVVENTLYVGTNGGELLALSTKDGTRLWAFQAQAIIRSSPVIWRDLVIFGSDDHNAYALDRKNGEEVWKYTAAKAIVAAPTVSGDALYFCSSDQPGPYGVLKQVHAFSLAER